MQKRTERQHDGAPVGRCNRFTAKSLVDVY
jgi:hypothetical protein